MIWKKRKCAVASCKGRDVNPGICSRCLRLLSPADRDALYRYYHDCPARHFSEKYGPHLRVCVIYLSMLRSCADEDVQQLRRAVLCDELGAGAILRDRLLDLGLVQH
jgi:hypothetical protein